MADQPAPKGLLGYTPLYGDLPKVPEGPAPGWSHGPRATGGAREPFFGVDRGVDPVPYGGWKLNPKAKAYYELYEKELQEALMEAQRSVYEGKYPWARDEPRDYEPDCEVEMKVEINKSTQVGVAKTGWVPVDAQGCVVIKANSAGGGSLLTWSSLDQCKQVNRGYKRYAQISIEVVVEAYTE